ncbi:DNA-binding NarL/FixJ family response regulator [Actinoplanes campanulatus]|uniref:DNA-binding NarL/FixJ family response regulator n=1 Tax=Actinoplanes campanulatus TaxID=113559 RepID=A0A7W5FD88_9ACTN|nr:DNA-binding NarL/FixJ family response regulator [Actinoplanes campanulatus]GGN33051.1 hypothetical protein GCM10010109_54650 [Actinoplanes campanulatus]GID38240.1 hypothetical protein Aca09nite_47460 [Actinoplanes campanulatus]
MRADLALAVLLAVTAVVGSRGAAEVSHPAVPLDPAGYALVVVAALACAVRRRKPLVTLVVAALCTAGYLAAGHPYGPILVLMMFAVLPTLTAREREIMVLAAEGLANDEIAGRLAISTATARTHVSRAMIKLGARDRAQLVVFAYQSGLLG